VESFSCKIHAWMQDVPSFRRRSSICKVLSKELFNFLNIKRDRARIDSSIRTLSDPRTSMPFALLCRMGWCRGANTLHLFAWMSNALFVLAYTSPTRHDYKMNGLTTVRDFESRPESEHRLSTTTIDVFAERLPDKEWSIMIWAEDRSLDSLFQDTPEYSLYYVISGAARGLLRLCPLTARRTVSRIGAVAPSDDTLVNFLQCIVSANFLHFD